MPGGVIEVRVDQGHAFVSLAAVIDLLDEMKGEEEKDPLVDSVIDVLLFPNVSMLVTLLDCPALHGDERLQKLKVMLVEMQRAAVAQSGVN